MTDGVLVTARSASVFTVSTVMFAVALLLLGTGSEQAAELQLAIETVSPIMVPFATPALTCRTGEKVTVPFKATLSPLFSVQVIVAGPTVPAVSVVQVQLVTAAIERNWRPVGICIVTV